MDVWNLAEIEECRQGLYKEVDAAVAERRFREFGGTVRYVLANTERTFADLTEEVGADTAAKLVYIDGLGLRNVGVSHTLAHIRVRRL